ncbi:MAG: hypothetical protein JZU52_17090 [Lamprocystis purpurea]|jgi:hypothetical protein|uniref:hypothetical protein n=1 Tax=Lamprocystis purpurea TaxID=61598 RepID=UPI00035C1CF2|nr:hypothetical protein [Lamprocystis purpurea]MBV5275279.1 hypothetical protein [Lamprocystis purpurea]
MCLAIPYGRKDGGGGTRLGRALRARPALAPAGAGVLILMLAALVPLLGGAHTWPWSLLLLIQGLATLALAALADRLPEHCRMSAPGYPRQTLLAITLGLGGGFIGFALLGDAEAGWRVLAGLSLLGLGWPLAAAPLRRQAAWCRVTPSALLRHLSATLNGSLTALILLAFGAWTGLTWISLTGATLGMVGVLLLVGALPRDAHHA